MKALEKRRYGKYVADIIKMDGRLFICIQILMLSAFIYKTNQEPQNKEYTVPTCSYDTLQNVSNIELYKYAQYWVDARQRSRAELRELAYEKLQLNGFVLLRGVMDTDEVSKLRQHVVDKYGRKKLPIPHLNDPEGRYDVGLNLTEDIVRETLNTAVHKLRPLYEKLVGEDGNLVELSCMFTCKSKAQKPHQDISGNLDPNVLSRGNCSSMYSTFIALQPTPAYIGATSILPRSYAKGSSIVWEYRRNTYLQFQINNETDAFAFQSDMLLPPKMMSATLGAGDVLIYNSLSVHGAGKNGLNLARMMFYYTFQSLGPFPVLDSTFSIDKKYGHYIKIPVSREVTDSCVTGAHSGAHRRVEVFTTKEYTVDTFRGKFSLLDFPLTVTHLNLTESL